MFIMDEWMLKILVIIVIVGVIVNFISMFDLFTKSKKDENTYKEINKNNNSASLKNKIIAYGWVLVIIIIFLFLTFSGWFAIVKDYMSIFST